MAAILSLPAQKHSTKAKGHGFVRRNCADEASGAARGAGYEGRCAIRLRLVISKSQRTRDTCLLQQVGLSSFLMNRLLDAFDKHAVHNCTDPRLRSRCVGPR